VDPPSGGLHPEPVAEPGEKSPSGVVKPPAAASADAQAPAASSAPTGPAPAAAVAPNGTGAPPSAPAIPRLIGPPSPLALSPSHLIVPLGEARDVILKGALTRPDVTVDPNGTLSVTVAPGPAPGSWRLTLQSEAPGPAVVRVSVDHRGQVLSARVMKFAGQVESAAVEVTGQPAPAEFVLRAARAAVEGVVRPESGATAAIGSPVSLPSDLVAGQTTSLAFPVTITGPDMLAVKSAATVTVRNRDLDPRDVGVLLYSNEPERITGAGTLFAAELTPDRPARLLYHHQNMGDGPLRIRVDLVNPTDQPADVQVIEGMAGPSRDPVEAGHSAAVRYLRSAMQDIGLIVRVRARTEQAIALQRMAPGATVSGLFGLRSLSPGLYARVSAEAAGDPPLSVRPAEQPDKLSEAVYLSPSRPEKARYVVGQRWAFMNLGSDPLLARGSRKKLFGNYGVSYELTIELSNPTGQPQSVALMLSPDAGAARGVFVIDGTLVEAPVVGPPIEANLAIFHLQPGERRTVRVQTLPVGGSSYPARLVIRPADPLRAAQR
jgi:hypothetical protein